MLDVFELAREKGEKEGVEKGRRESLQEVVIDTIFELFGNLPSDMIDKIKSISHLEILKGINRKALKCKDIEQFQEILNGVA